MGKAVKNLVLYGPPGTGKTRRLLKIVTEHLQDRPSGRVLFCSHTRAAAQEAASRWADNVTRIDIQTLHSVCFRTLKFSKAQTVDRDKLDEFGKEFGIDMSDQGLGKEFLEVLTMADAKGMSIEDGYAHSVRPGTPKHYLSFCLSYLQWKKTFGYIDFNDMLINGATKLKAADVPYTLIAIDEAQDLTQLHWRVIYRLIELLPNCQIVIAGDDDQALFSFAGADPHGMPTFAERTGAISEVLSQSYRITAQVHALAQAIIGRVERRVPKEYAPRTGLDGKPAQGVYEVWPHMDHLAVDAGRDSLLLYNDRFVRGEVEPILREHNLPYRALNGYQAPLDSRAGRALRCVFTHSDAEILDNQELRNEVKGGLSRAGNDAWDMVAPREVLAKIRRFDWVVLSVRPGHIDYLRAIDYQRPQNLRISTMHGAKGLQADDVHLILSLSQRAWREAEVDADHLHRLFYTAVTRAKENLYIYDGENGYELPAEFR